MGHPIAAANDSKSPQGADIGTRKSQNRDQPRPPVTTKSEPGQIQMDAHAATLNNSTLNNACFPPAT